MVVVVVVVTAVVRGVVVAVTVIGVVCVVVVVVAVASEITLCFVLTVNIKQLLSQFELHAQLLLLLLRAR